jgi:hypothetical protein
MMHLKNYRHQPQLPWHFQHLLLKVLLSGRFPKKSFVGVRLEGFALALEGVAFSPLSNLSSFIGVCLEGVAFSALSALDLEGVCLEGVAILALPHYLWKVLVWKVLLSRRFPHYLWKVFIWKVLLPRQYHQILWKGYLSDVLLSPSYLDRQPQEGGFYCPFRRQLFPS